MSSSGGEGCPCRAIFTQTSGEPLVDSHMSVRTVDTSWLCVTFSCLVRSHTPLGVCLALGPWVPFHMVLWMPRVLMSRRRSSFSMCADFAESNSSRGWTCTGPCILHH